MAIAVQPQAAGLRNLCETLVHDRQQVADDAFISGPQILRQETALQEEPAGLPAEVFNGELLPVSVGAAGADAVDAADEASQPDQRVVVIQFRRPAGAARIEGETQSLMMMQRDA